MEWWQLSAACTRKSWRYDMAADSWRSIPDAPYHIERGGSVVLKQRYILNLGTHLVYSLSCAVPTELERFR